MNQETVGALQVLGGASVAFPSLEEKIEADARSIYVGQVEYNATAEDVEAHFRGCGAVNRVTIMRSFVYTCNFKIWQLTIFAAHFGNAQLHEYTFSVDLVFF